RQPTVHARAPGRFDRAGQVVRQRTGQAAGTALLVVQQGRPKLAGILSGRVNRRLVRVLDDLAPAVWPAGRTPDRPGTIANHAVARQHQIDQLSNYAHTSRSWPGQAQRSRPSLICGPPLSLGTASYSAKIGLVPWPGLLIAG